MWCSYKQCGVRTNNVVHRSACGNVAAADGAHTQVPHTHHTQSYTYHTHISYTYHTNIIHKRTPHTQSCTRWHKRYNGRQNHSFLISVYYWMNIWFKYLTNIWLKYLIRISDSIIWLEYLSNIWLAFWYKYLHQGELQWGAHNLWQCEGQAGQSLSYPHQKSRKSVLFQSVYDVVRRCGNVFNIGNNDSRKSPKKDQHSTTSDWDPDRPQGLVDQQRQEQPWCSSPLVDQNSAHPATWIHQPTPLTSFLEMPHKKWQFIHITHLHYSKPTKQWGDREVT